MAKKILIVDDEPGIRKLLSLKIEGKGYCVLTACDGAEAVQLAKEENPDLILLDLTMPVMGGCQAPAALRSHETTKHRPIIFLTALVSPGEVFSEEHNMTFAKMDDLALLMDKIDQEVGK